MLRIVSRDRCGLYAQGARKGSPDARQVADRFHLLQNLRHTIEQQLSRAPRRSCPTRIIGGSISPPAEEPDPAEHQWSAAAGRRAMWQAKFDRVKELQAEGTNPVGIVRATGTNWRTVAAWMRLQALPGRNMMAPKLTTPACFHDHLAARWSEGCTLGRVLLAEIKELGYIGSFSHLARFLANWRRAGRVMIAETSVIDEVEFAPPSPPAVPPIVGAALCVKPRGMLTPRQAEKVADFKQSSTEFTTLRALAMRFRGILRGRDPTKLDAWLHDALCSGLYCLRRFVRTLKRDIDAVRNAISEPWSNGQTEGQINKLKTLKRAMFGRAGIELLRARILPLS